MRLHEQVAQQKIELEVLREGLDRMKAYLNTPKFRDDVYVNKDDMLKYIEEIKLDAWLASD